MWFKNWEKETSVERWWDYKCESWGLPTWNRHNLRCSRLCFLLLMGQQRLRIHNELRLSPESHKMGRACKPCKSYLNQIDYHYLWQLVYCCQAHLRPQILCIPRLPSKTSFLPSLNLKIQLFGVEYCNDEFPHGSYDLRNAASMPSCTTPNPIRLGSTTTHYCYGRHVSPKWCPHVMLTL